MPFFGSFARSPLFRQLKAEFQIANNALTEEGERPLRRVTRREMLQRSLQVAGGLTAASLAPQLLSTPARANSPQAYSSKRPMDTITIVGGGIAGLTTAYRLAKQGRPVEVFEASPRFGGRMFTRQQFHGSGSPQFCELGGELVDTNHTDLKELCEELGLTLQDLRNSDTGVRYHIQNELRSDQDIIAAYRPLALQLAKDLKAAFPTGEVFVPTYQTTIQDYPELHTLDSLSLEYYLNHIPNLQPWVRKVLEIAYVGEYGLEASEQSALNLLLMLPDNVENSVELFGESDEAFRITGGNSQLPLAVAKALRRLDVPMHSQHVLKRIEADSSGTHYTLTFDRGGKAIDVTTQYLVLAMPLAVLRGIEGLDTLPINDRQRSAIQELGVGSNSKLMLGFDSRFWQAKNGLNSEGLNAMYTDQGSQAFWDTSRQQDDKEGILTNFMGGHTGLNANTQHIQKALDDLQGIFNALAVTENTPTLNIKQSEFNRHTALMNWTQYRWAKGSYSCPKPGQYTAYVGCFEEPAGYGHLQFVGEYASVDYMGFMNGAIESANRASKTLSDLLTESEAGC
jgi:monoamine oxidase